MSNRAESFLAGLSGDGAMPSLTPPTHEREGHVQGLRFLSRLGMDTVLVCSNVATAGSDDDGLRAEQLADTAALETLLRQPGFVCSGRHRTKNVQLWTMGHARVTINEGFSQESRDAGPAISAEVASPSGLLPSQVMLTRDRGVRPVLNRAPQVQREDAGHGSVWTRPFWPLSGTSTCSTTAMPTANSCTSARPPSAACSEMVERRGAYDCHGSPNAPVLHAVRNNHLHLTT